MLSRSMGAACISRFCTDAGTASILEVFRPLVLIVFVLRVLAVPKYSISSVCLVKLGVRSILLPSVHLVDNSQAYCSAQITHRWFDEWELEELLSLGTTTCSTGIISGICTARSMYCEYSQYLDVPFI